MLSALLQDLRYAVRTFMKSPGFTAAVVITLALGIAANTAMFSLLNAVVLRTLPVPDPQHLWLLYQQSPPAVGDVIGGLERSDIFAHSALRRMEAAVPREASVAGMSSIAGVSVRIGRAAEGAPASLQLVSGSFFATVGITPEAGRVLAPDDNRVIDGHPIAVLRYGFAQQHFGDAQSAIGGAIAINGVSLTVIGVAQRGFQGVSIGNAVDVWLPTTMQHAVAYRMNAATHNAQGMEPWVPQSGVEWLNLVVRAPRETIDAVQDAVAGAFREEIAVEGARRGQSPATDSTPPERASTGVVCGRVLCRQDAVFRCVAVSCGHGHVAAADGVRQHSKPALGSRCCATTRNRRSSVCRCQPWAPGPPNVGGKCCPRAPRNARGVTRRPMGKRGAGGIGGGTKYAAARVCARRSRPVVYRGCRRCVYSPFWIVPGGSGHGVSGRRFDEKRRRERHVRNANDATVGGRAGRAVSSPGGGSRVVRS